MNTKPQREGFVEAEPVDPPVVEPAAPPEPTEPPREDWPIKIKLRKPIRDNKGDPVNELSFRQPTGADINRNGLPVRIDIYGDVQIDERKMTAMMTALTGVMTPFLETMDTRDWATCAYRLRNFFLPGWDA